MPSKHLETLSKDYRPVVTDYITLDEHVALRDDPRPVVETRFVKLTGTVANILEADSVSDTCSDMACAGSGASILPPHLCAFHRRCYVGLISCPLWVRRLLPYKTGM